MGEAWMPFVARRHTDKELIAMEHHVEALRRPVSQDIRAYRLNAARESRMQNSPRDPTGNHSPMFYRSERPAAAGSSSAQTPRPAFGGSGVLSTPSPSPRDPYASGRASTRSSRAGDERGGRRASVTRPTARSARSLPPPSTHSLSRHATPAPPLTTEAVYAEVSLKGTHGAHPGAAAPTARAATRAAMRARAAEAGDEVLPPPPPPEEALRGFARSDSARDRSRERRTVRISKEPPLVGRAAFRRSKSAPLRRAPAAPEVMAGGLGGSSAGLHVRSLDQPSRDRDRLVRNIGDLVAQLGKMSAQGKAVGTTGVDAGWHIVVSELERQLSEEKLKTRHSEAMRASYKESALKEAEREFVWQMSEMEAFYEAKLAAAQSDVQQAERVGSELRREAAELREMLQAAGHGHGHTSDVAECCLLSTSPSPSPSPAPVPTPPPLRHSLRQHLGAHADANGVGGGDGRPYVTSAADAVTPPPAIEDLNAANLVPVALSPHNPACLDDPTPLTIPTTPLQDLREQQGERGTTTGPGLRATVSVMTPPKTAPSPSSYLSTTSRSQSRSVSLEPKGVDPVSPSRHYLELVEKNVAAKQFVSAKTDYRAAQPLDGRSPYGGSPPRRDSSPPIVTTPPVVGRRLHNV